LLWPFRAESLLVPEVMGAFITPASSGRAAAHRIEQPAGAGVRGLNSELFCNLQPYAAAQVCLQSLKSLLLTFPLAQQQP